MRAAKRGTIEAKIVQRHLRSLSNPEFSKRSLRFFKTGVGDYGEGDDFLGIRVPVLRAEVKRFASLPLGEVAVLLRSSFHEERMFALLLLVYQFVRSDDDNQSSIYDFYLSNTQYINNWDLVDCSAYKIVGVYLLNRSRKPLHKLAKSSVLWERRIAIISTLHFIKHDDFSDTLKLSKILLHDEEDLMQKAVGWMLREVGNRDRRAEEEFLQQHYKVMPRTMLRYAIEKFPEKKRQLYLKGNI